MLKRKKIKKYSQKWSHLEFARKNEAVNAYFGIMIEVDDGGEMLVLQLLILLHTSTDDFDGGVDGSINDDTHDGLSASGSGFIAGNITDVDRLIGKTLPTDC